MDVLFVFAFGHQNVQLALLVCVPGPQCALAGLKRSRRGGYGIQHL